MIRMIPVYAGDSDDAILGDFASMNGILGGPDDVIRKMQAYSEAGVEEFVIQWFGLYDLESLQTIASEILPNFAAAK